MASTRPAGRYVPPHMRARAPEQKQPLTRMPALEAKERPQLGLNTAQFQEIARIIRTTMDDGRVSAVKAPTGSGKSTYTVASFLENQLCKRVLVVVPTILAAKSLSSYMGRQFDGIYTVGCGADSRRNYSDTTQIVYCTTGHMLSLLMEYAKVSTVSAAFAFDMVMIDEAHSDSADYTTIMCLFRYFRDAGRVIPLIILASATIAVEMTPFPTCPTYEIQTQGHPIEIIYHARDVHDDELIVETAKVVNQFSAQLPLDEKNAIFIVFMSGSNECETLATEIDENYRNAVHPWEIHTIYGQKTSDDGDATEHRVRVLEPPKLGHRKVVIATNVAESSITIPDARLIVCTGKQKILTKNHTGGTTLLEVPISKSSANQRKGRTGRTCPGTVYRVYTEKNYNQRPQLLEPEIKRINPARIILPILDVGLDPVDVFTGYLERETIEETIEQLKKLQMVDDALISTPLGQFVCKLPLGIYEGALLWRLLNDPMLRDFKFESMSLVCAIACYGPSSYFAYTRQSRGREEAYFADKFADFVDGCQTDVEVMGRVLEAYFTRFGTDIHRLNSHGIRRWCKERTFFAPTVETLLKTMRDVVNRLGRIRMEIQIPVESSYREDYYAYFYEHASRVYADKLHRRTNPFRPQYHAVDAEGKIKNMTPYLVANKKVLMEHRQPKEEIIVLDTHSFVSRNTGGTVNLITLHLPYIPEPIESESASPSSTEDDEDEE